MSARRAWWTVVLCLALLAVALIKPLRAIPERWCFAMLVGDQATVSSLSLHSKLDVLELRDLHVKLARDTNSLTLDAPQVFAKFDRTELLDKRLHVYRLRMKDTTLQLKENVSLVPWQPKTPWQQELRQLSTTLGWAVFQQQSDALLATTTLSQTWDDRVRRWMMRSQQIVVHAKQITSEISQFTNPLRHADEIRRQLTLLEQLASEQTEIQNQIKSAPSALQTDIERLKPLRDSDLAGFTASLDRRCDSLNDSLVQQQVERQLHELWAAHAPLATVSTMLITSQDRYQSPYNQNIRELKHTTPFVGVDEVAIEGMFEATEKYPFKATGQMGLMNNSAHQYRVLSSIDFQFGNAQHVTAISVDRHDAESNSLDVTSKLVRRPTSAIVGESGIPYTILSDDEFDSSQPILEVKVACEAQHITGTCKLHPAGYASDTANLPSLEYQVEGAWYAPRFSLMSTLPTDFDAGAKAAIENEASALSTNVSGSFDAELERRASQLKSHVVDQLETGLVSVQEQGKVVSNLRDELQRVLAEHEGLEWARLPNSQQTR